MRANLDKWWLLPLGVLATYALSPRLRPRARPPLYGHLRKRAV